MHKEGHVSSHVSGDADFCAPRVLTPALCPHVTATSNANPNPPPRIWTSGPRRSHRARGGFSSGVRPPPFVPLPLGIINKLRQDGMFSSGRGDNRVPGSPWSGPLREGGDTRGSGAGKLVWEGDGWGHFVCDFACTIRMVMPVFFSPGVNSSFESGKGNS